MNDIFQTIIVYALPVIFAITVHEAAHAYVAKYFGDNTAFAAGRMTLDPFKHIDPIGTIVMPIALFVLSEGRFTFGYAKPVPVDFSRLRNPKKQMAFVALAGPLSNFIMAFFWMALLVIVRGAPTDFIPMVAQAGIMVNIIMFVFNLIPIPPLDGGRVMTSILPHRLANQYARLEPYGMMIVLALVIFHVLDRPLMFFAGLTQLVLVAPFSLFF